MSRLALIDPKTLIGEAVRDLVATQVEGWDQIELFASDPEEVGGVTQVAGRAALVQALDLEILSTLDAALFCGDEVSPDVLESIPTGCRSIFIDPESQVADAVPVVAGLNDEDVPGTPRLLSPSPAVLLVSHLVAPLRQFGGLEVVAHVLQPASARGKAALDELFDQTRSILSMSDERPESMFGTQLAFNLLPWTVQSGPVVQHIETVLGKEVVARVHLSQAGVFHGCSAGVFVHFAEDPGTAAIEESLLESARIERTEVPDELGPLAAATSHKILIGEVTRSPNGGYWLWSAMDNLAASAQNALALARL